MHGKSRDLKRLHIVQSINEGLKVVTNDISKGKKSVARTRSLSEHHAALWSCPSLSSSFKV